MHTMSPFMRVSRVLFWAGFIMLLLTGFVSRFQHLDMPPIDFPSDRQKSNTLIIEKMIGGESILDFRGEWLELRMLPWLVANNSVMCEWFRCEIWTLARIFSLFFGLLTVAITPMIGYYTLGDQGVSVQRRYLGALIMMAAMALNPYHVELSRMITTEPLTLACQAAMVGFFWIAQRRPAVKRTWFICIILMGLSVMGKIPSLIWLPSMAIYFLFTKGLKTKWKIIFGFLGMIILFMVFWLQEVNPFRIYDSYSMKYTVHSTEAGAFMHGDIWQRTYIGRCFLMLTFPGVCLCFLGLFVAPWFYRITFLFCIAILYPLNNLNIYNFSHLILPGMILATYGAMLLLELPASNNIIRFPGTLYSGWRQSAGWVTGSLLLMAFIVLLSPLGPQFNRVDNLRGELIQPAQVVNRLEPRPSRISTADGTGSLGYFINRAFPDMRVLIQKDYMPGYASSHYTLDRYSVDTLKTLSRSWVDWASLPGEFGGLVVSSQLERPINISDSKFMTLIPKPDTQHDGLKINKIRVMRSDANFQNQMLNVSPGDRFSLEILWDNPENYRLAALYTMHHDWKQMVPMPVRKGGLTLNTRAVLCIPESHPFAARYTLELPPNFPSGTYYVYYFPVRANEWGVVTPKPVPLPLVINCSPNVDHAPDKISASFIDAWPLYHDNSKILWRDALHYKDMIVEGYEPSFMAAKLGYLLSTPGSNAGRYTLTLTSDATPITSVTSREFNWPEIQVYLPHSPNKPVGSVRVDSKKIGSFSLTFHADKSFDSIRIMSNLQQAKMGRMPLWLMHFYPAEYGERRYQRINLRGYELKREQNTL